jgi:hypothetical protein
MPELGRAFTGEQTVVMPGGGRAAPYTGTRRGDSLARPYAATRGRVRLRNGHVDPDTLVVARAEIGHPVVVPPASWPILVRLARPVTPVELAGETGMILNTVLYHLDEMVERGLIDLVRAHTTADADTPAAVTLLERILEGVRRL